MPAFDGSRYQARFDDLAAQGFDVHGEADLVESLGGGLVLDAGCGTGRVAIELARRGFTVVGVDVDRSMLAEARRRAPEIEWVEADLCELELGRRFEVVVLAGNVPLFCPAQSRPDLVARCGEHVMSGGFLVAGFQIDGEYRLEDWDEGCRKAGLELVERWSTWDRAAFDSGSTYAVSVFRR
ncbi:MAG TPA: class I SAM-dependent methyltransferase [Acidimicrobiales bacterium]|nr:class I SAM-dependent methyltransferase [Acidimicrobiales bacterium]